MSAKKKDRIDPDEVPGGLTHNPFAALRPDGKPAEDSASAEAPAAGNPPAQGGTLVVRREKKGRGGKTVTRVTGLDGSRASRDEIARDMKKALGCGASVEGRDVVLQGSMTERAAKWLEERLGARVTIGN